MPKHHRWPAGGRSRGFDLRARAWMSRSSRSALTTSYQSGDLRVMVFLSPPITVAPNYAPMIALIVALSTYWSKRTIVPSEISKTWVTAARTLLPVALPLAT